MKKILVSATCVDSEIGDHLESDKMPESFCVDITDQRKAQIVQLNKLAKENNACCIKVGCNGFWSKKIASVSDSTLDAKFSQIKADSLYPDNSVMSVSADGFSFEAIPQHGDESMLFRTHKIPVSFLNSNNECFVRL